MMYEKFEKLLKERHVTANKVAIATGVTSATLSAWKRGEYTPKKEKIQKIADFFEIPITYFYSEEDDPAYYYNEQTAKMAEELANKPGLRVLFDASRDLNEDSLKMFAEMINTYKKTNPDG